MRNRNAAARYIIVAVEILKFLNRKVVNIAIIYSLCYINIFDAQEIISSDITVGRGFFSPIANADIRYIMVMILIKKCWIHGSGQPGAIS
jgi:hypothetical protein